MSVSREVAELRAELRELRETVARLQDRHHSSGLWYPRVVEGVISAGVTISESANANSFVGTKVTMRIFSTDDRDAESYVDTGETVQGVVAVPGDYEAGCYCIGLQFRDGNWRIITLGCDPTVPVA